MDRKLPRDVSASLQSPLGDHQDNHGKRFLAAIAGVGQVGTDTVHFDHMEVAKIATDGSVGEWRMCPFHLKGGRSAPATFITGGYLYVLGGWGDLLLSDVFTDIQYAPLRSEGCADPWHTNPTRLLMPLYGHTSVVVGPPDSQIVLVLGGNSGNGNYAATAQAAKLAISGSISRWYLSQSPLSTGRWGHVTRAIQRLYLCHRRRSTCTNTISFGRASHPPEITLVGEEALFSVLAAGKTTYPFSPFLCTQCLRGRQRDARSTFDRRLHRVCKSVCYGLGGHVLDGYLKLGPQSLDEQVLHRERPGCHYRREVLRRKC